MSTVAPEIHAAHEDMRRALDRLRRQREKVQAINRHHPDPDRTALLERLASIELLIIRVLEETDSDALQQLLLEAETRSGGN